MTDSAPAIGGAGAPLKHAGATRGVRFFWLAVFFLSPLVPIAMYFHRQWWTFFHSWSYAMVAGIFAFGWINNQFILAARIKYFDRIFGLDRIMRFHGNMGIIIALLIVAHAALKSLYIFERNLQIILGVLATQIFMAVIVVSVLFFSSTFLMRLQPLRRLRQFSARKLRLQYQHLRLFHNLSVVAAALVAGHVVLASSTAETLSRQIVMAGWFGVALVMYVDHKILRPFRLRRRPFTVTNVVEEGPGVTTIHMAIPPGREWNGLAGQFAFFALLPSREEHPFTLSSPAGGANGEITFTGKNLGDWSGALSNVEQGESVAVDGPYGLFTLPPADSGRKLVMLAGGIGITPFLSMLRTIARDVANQENADSIARMWEVELVWNVRYRSDLFCRAELEDIARTVPGVSWTPVISREEDDNGKRGRLDAAWLQQWLSQRADAADRDYFLCGPAGQMEMLISVLISAGVPKQHIHFENFAM
jgi:predicted ferric reductase